MKFLFDIFPVILFFIAYKLGENHNELAQKLANQFLSDFISGHQVSLEQGPILLATALAIIAALLQIGFLLFTRKKIEAMLWISFIVIVGFGSATIYFHSDTFIKWKPTVISWCYAAAFILGQFIFKKNLIKTAMSSQIQLPEPVWEKLSLAWIGYFLLMGGLNLYVAFNFSQSAWVSYKLYSLALIPIFIVAQGIALAKYIEEPT